LPSGVAETLAEATSRELVFPSLAATDRRGVLAELAAGFAAALAGVAAADVEHGLLEREALGSTALGRGLAVPHCRVAGIDRPWLAVGLQPRGIPFDAVDGEPVRVFLALISPASDPASHLQLLAAISRWARGDGALDRLLSAPDPESVLAVLGGAGAR
jgi:mannitol/fructose-specific phosphotransferase system IIA component (Ntr-type)